MGNLGRLSSVDVVIAILGISRAVSKQYGWDKESALQLFRDLSDRLGFWAIPLYVLTHTVTLALCLPYAVFFEAGASVLFVLRFLVLLFLSGSAGAFELHVEVWGRFENYLGILILKMDGNLKLHI